VTDNFFTDGQINHANLQSSLERPLHLPLSAESINPRPMLVSNQMRICSEREVLSKNDNEKRKFLNSSSRTSNNDYA
jgi:hypothetical protein